MKSVAHLLHSRPTTHRDCCPTQTFFIRWSRLCCWLLGWPVCRTLDRHALARHAGGKAKAGLCDAGRQRRASSSSVCDSRLFFSFFRLHSHLVSHGSQHASFLVSHPGMSNRALDQLNHRLQRCDHPVQAQNTHRPLRLLDRRLCWSARLELPDFCKG